MLKRNNTHTGFSFISRKLILLFILTLTFSFSPYCDDDKVKDPNLGVTWKTVAKSPGFACSGIAFGDGRFVTGGTAFDKNLKSESKMAYSDDGKTWTTAEKSAFSNNVLLTVIAYGKGRFVSGGTDGKMAYSSNGKTWTATEKAAFSNNVLITAIAYGDGRFVAAGLTIDIEKGLKKGTSETEIAYSSDKGVTWTKVKDTIFGKDAIYLIAYGKGKFIAGGYDGNMAYSDDGVTWTAVGKSALNKNIISIAYGKGKFVAGGSDGKIAYSSDGVTWTAVEKSALNKDIFIAYGGGRFVAGGDKGNMAYSDDGVTWTAVEKSVLKESIISIAYGNGRFVAVDIEGNMSYSPAD